MAELCFGLYDTDIRTFDDVEPNSDEGNGEPTVSATLIIYKETESVTLEFGALSEKRNFITALGAFLELQSGNSSGSETSTLYIPWRSRLP